MKTLKNLNLFLGFAFLFLAVLYPVSGIVPSMFAVVMMCLTICIHSFSDYLELKHKEEYQSQ